MRVPPSVELSFRNLVFIVAALSMNTNAVAQPGDDFKTASLPDQAVFRLGTECFRQHGEVKQVKYFNDGKRIASISREAILIWDARTGQRLRQLRCKDNPQHSRHFTGMAISPDGEELAACDMYKVYVWDVESGVELLSFSKEDESGLGDDAELCYSPGGDRLAVLNGLSVLLVDMDNGKPVRKLSIENHRAAFYGICWSPDGKHLSAGTTDPAVVTWNVESGDVVKRFKANKEDVFSRSPTMSSDGKWLLVSTGGMIDLWQFASTAHLKRIETDADFINTLVLTPDNQTLIVGSQDGKIRILNAETGELRHKIDGRLWIGRSLAVSPDFQKVALGAVLPTIRQWDVQTGAELLPEITSYGHDAEAQCAIYSPDGRLIASGGPNRQLFLWEADTGKLRSKLPTESSVNNIAFTPSGQHLLTSWQTSPAIRIWDVATGQNTRTIESGAKKIKAFTLTSNGTQMIAVVSDSTAVWHSPIGKEKFQVWQFDTGEKLREFSFQTASTEAIALTADGKFLITGAANGIIHAMNLESGEEQSTLAGHNHTVDSLAISGDGKLLASGSTDQTICIWDTETWEKRHVLKGHKRAVTSVVFAPNSHILASGSGKVNYPIHSTDPYRIRLWNVDSGEQIGSLSGHQSNTSAVAFSPNGRRLVSAHDNTTLLIWDVSQMAGQ